MSRPDSGPNKPSEALSIREMLALADGPRHGTRPMCVATIGSGLPLPGLRRVTAAGPSAAQGVREMLALPDDPPGEMCAATIGSGLPLPGQRRVTAAQPSAGLSVREMLAAASEPPTGTRLERAATIDSGLPLPGLRRVTAASRGLAAGAAAARATGEAGLTQAAVHAARTWTEADCVGVRPEAALPESLPMTMVAPMVLRQMALEYEPLRGARRVTTARRDWPPMPPLPPGLAAAAAAAHDPRTTRRRWHAAVRVMEARETLPALTYGEIIAEVVAQIQAIGQSNNTARGFMDDARAGLSLWYKVTIATRDPALHRVRRALAREGRGLAPVASAVPMTGEFVMRFMMNEALPAELRIILGLAWARSARIGDVLRLLWGDLWVVSLTQVVTIWRADKTHQVHDALRLQLTVPPILGGLCYLLCQRSTTASGPARRIFAAWTTADVVRRLPAPFSAHSARIGSLQTHALLGVPLPELAQLSRHRSTVTLLRYLRGWSTSASNISATSATRYFWPGWTPPSATTAASCFAP